MSCVAMRNTRTIPITHKSASAAERSFALWFHIYSRKTPNAARAVLFQSYHPKRWASLRDRRATSPDGHKSEMKTQSVTTSCGQGVLSGNIVIRLESSLADIGWRQPASCQWP